MPTRDLVGILADELESIGSVKICWLETGLITVLGAGMVGVGAGTAWSVTIAVVDGIVGVILVRVMGTITGVVLTAAGMFLGSTLESVGIIGVIIFLGLRDSCDISEA